MSGSGLSSLTWDQTHSGPAVEDGQGGPLSGLPGLDVQHQLTEDLHAVLAGLQLVVELVEGQLVPGQALLQLANQQPVVGPC